MKYKLNNNKPLQITKALALSLLLTNLTQAHANQTTNFTSIPEADFNRVQQAWYAQEQFDLPKKLFSTYSKANQYLILGEYLWLQDIDLAKAQTYLTAALTAYQQQPNSLNQHDAGYLYYALANVSEQQQQYNQASEYFSQAIKLEYSSACVNYGVMHERLGDYLAAIQVYETCPQTLKQQEYLVYHNLGTIYYNGWGVKQNRALGAQHWQTAYKMFNYDSDVNYNMGIYHYYQTKNYGQARYHFAACAIKDKDCATWLGDSQLINPTKYADKHYLNQILQAQNAKRSYLLEDRLRYWLDKERFFASAGPQTDNISFYHDALSDDRLGQPPQTIWVTAPIQQAETAIYLLNRLIYVDMFTALNTYLMGIDVTKPTNSPITFNHLGQTHQLEITKDQVRYQIQFCE